MKIRYIKYISVFIDILDQYILVLILCASKQLFPPVWDLIFWDGRAKTPGFSLDGDTTSALPPSVKSRLDPEGMSSKNPWG